MSSGLLGIIKCAALDAVDNAQMCDLRFGEVVSTSPIRVKVTNQFTLPSALLIVPQHLTDYEVNVVIDDEEKPMSVKNALKIGDRVALVRKQGGQSYFILDRI